MKSQEQKLVQTSRDALWKPVSIIMEVAWQALNLNKLNDSKLYDFKATSLSLPVGFTRLTKVVVKCGDLSHKIFAPNKGIRLTRFCFRQS